MITYQTEIGLLIKEFDELCNSVAPSKVILDIQSYENSHLAKILNDYGRFVSQFELYYHIIVDASYAINYIEKSHWPKHRGVQFLLMVHNLKSLYSSFNLFTRGFYEDSLILARSVYESFIKAIYISCYPVDPAAIAASRKGNDGRKFNLTNFIRDELKLDWHDYGLSSAFAHANFFSVLSELRRIQEGNYKEAVTLKFQFDKKLAEVCINYLNYLLLVNLKELQTLFATSMNHILTPEMVNKINKLIVLRERNILMHPKDYWPKVVKDTQDIFHMIEVVETTQKDWKQVWENLRVGKA